MFIFKRKVAPLSARIAAELEYTELQLLEAEGKLENAIGERDTLARRRERLYAALGSQLVEEGVTCPHGVKGNWSDDCPDCRH
jgi:hypothetical protein